ncbi:DegT/DnrJ/EryC1/StrS aminotransferase [Parafrankia sp. EAN1pec]|uniref:DegT/DnrJ/EryC1/StrS family aminotransferase n=1 Tax=Parafrankia sp. (strain EAN1pec) TaxID=298653 RepID=UPI0000544AEC|nr:DegT/DnrJ/EryC1/StrS aminotransferase [Frankia sp. EAN1pec]
MTSTLSPPRAGVEANARPYLHGPETDALTAVLLSGQYTHGPETEAFETELAAFLGVPDVVCVATGTAALHLGLLAAGVGPGHEVIVPSLTFAASVQAIRATGATPRFVDIDPATLCIRDDHIRAALTPATKAVMPVLYGGRAVPLPGIRAELDRRDVAVVEDAAHAFGSRQDGVRVGAAGALTCFSFDPIKNITCGDGGAVIPRTPAEADQLRTLRLLGITATPSDRATVTTYIVEGPGFRTHLSALNAAVGRVQLAHFAEIAKRRIGLWHAYNDALAGVGGVTVVDVDILNTVPFHFVVQIPDRDRVFHRLRAAGIGVGAPYPPNHLQPAFTPWRTPLPATEQAAARILSLPFHPALTPGDVQHVTDLLDQALTDARPRADG